MSTGAIRGARHSMMSRRNHQGKPVPALETVEETSMLGRVLAHAHRILTLDNELAQWLDTPLKAHCRVAAAGPGRLVLEADSPVWAQRLRFLLPDLGTHFGREVTIRIAPAELSTAPISASRTQVSREAAAALNDLAAVMDNDALKEVLQRIARHAD